MENKNPVTVNGTFQGSGAAQLPCKHGCVVIPDSSKKTKES